MKKKYLIIPMFLGALLTLSLTFINSYNVGENTSYSASYSSRIEKYRQKAIESLVQVDTTLYRTAQAEEIASLRQNTIEKINNSEDYSEIDSLVSSFNRYILIIKTDAQMTEEEAEQIPVEECYSISSLDELLEFRDDVNSGYNYKGEIVKLTADIVIPNNFAFGDSIGNTDAKAFSGTFDGDGHTISGLTLSGHDSIALFSRVTDGVVKNLKMANVNITVTGAQRGAAVVARVYNATVENVEVLSGTITGLTQNGGIAAVCVMGCTIKNCINRANINSSDKTYNGGILGLVYSGKCTIQDCINYGTITSRLVNETAFSKCLGTGGILGGTLSSAPASGHETPSCTIQNCTNNGEVISDGEATGGIAGQVGNKQDNKLFEIINCVNNANVTGKAIGTGGIVGSYPTVINFIAVIDGAINNGVISGTTYVGGIVGIARIAVQEESKIVDCINMANIVASGKVGVGGITGFSRINITNCSVLHSVQIKGVAASALPDIGCEVDGGGGSTSGKYGYISGGMGNGAVQSGGKLINSDGSDYNA